VFSLTSGPRHQSPPSHTFPATSWRQAT
jgi:hypothetical protein